MHVFSTFSTIKLKPCGLSGAKCLFMCNFTCQKQKITIYFDFNLVSNFR